MFRRAPRTTRTRVCACVSRLLLHCATRGVNCVLIEEKACERHTVAAKVSGMPPPPKYFKAK